MNTAFQWRAGGTVHTIQLRTYLYTGYRAESVDARQRFSLCYLPPSLCVTSNAWRGLTVLFVCLSGCGRFEYDGGSAARGNRRPSGRYGDYSCDAPWDLIESAANAMQLRQGDNIEFVLWTG